MTVNVNVKRGSSSKSKKRPLFWERDDNDAWRPGQVVTSSDEDGFEEEGSAERRRRKRARRVWEN